VPSSITRSVLERAATWLILGLTIGAASALLFGRLIRALLFEAQAEEPVVYVCAIAVLAIIGMWAAYVPARRAARVDPLVALRYE
jgi:putative ABC transport system permease protein